MNVKKESLDGAVPPPEAGAVSPEDVAPYLRALRLARADLLSGQIRGERTSNVVDDAVDAVLDRFFANQEPDRGQVVTL
jgi:hypothetical protein